jgi:succinoglycan biosynthesis protein ExoA
MSVLSVEQPTLRDGGRCSRPQPEAADLPFISVVIPTWNEEKNVGQTLRRLTATSYPHDLIEFMVVDGGSADRTQAIAREIARENHIIRVLDNPRRLQGEAINLSVEAADPRSEWIVRCDCHTNYPEDFVARVMATAVKLAPDYAGIVYVLRPSTNSPECFRNASGWAYGSFLGGGNSAYRTGAPIGQIDHGQHGAFRRDALKQIGGYTAGMVANEDVDLSWRLRDLGYKLWIAGDLPLAYKSRSTPWSLARQFLHYGQGRALLMQRHRRAFKPRHLPLAAILPATLLVTLLSSIYPLILLTFIPYLLVLFTAGCFAVCQTRRLCLVGVPLALAVMHYSWSVGFIEQLATSFSGRRWPRESSQVAGISRH